MEMFFAADSPRVIQRSIFSRFHTNASRTEPSGESGSTVTNSTPAGTGGWWPNTRAEPFDERLQHRRRDLRQSVNRQNPRRA